MIVKLERILRKSKQGLYEDYMTTPIKSRVILPSPALEQLHLPQYMDFGNDS